MGNPRVLDLCWVCINNTAPFNARSHLVNSGERKSQGKGYYLEWLIDTVSNRKARSLLIINAHSHLVGGGKRIGQGCLLVYSKPTDWMLSAKFKGEELIIDEPP